MTTPFWKKQNGQSASPLAIQTAVQLLKIVEAGMASPDTMARACDRMLKETRLADTLKVLTSVWTEERVKGCKCANGIHKEDCRLGFLTRLMEHMSKGVSQVPLAEYRASIPDHYMPHALSVYRKGKLEILEMFREDWQAQVAAGETNDSLEEFAATACRLQDPITIPTAASDEQIARCREVFFDGCHPFWDASPGPAIIQDFKEQIGNGKLCPLVDAAASGVVAYVLTEHVDRLVDLLNAAASEVWLQKRVKQSSEEKTEENNG